MADKGFISELERLQQSFGKTQMNGGRGGRAFCVFKEGVDIDDKWMMNYKLSRFGFQESLLQKPLKVLGP